MILFIKTLTGSTIELEVEPNTTISAIKEKIYAQKKIPVEEQWILFQGKTCKDERTCADYEWDKGGEIFLVVKTAQATVSSDSFPSYISNLSDNELLLNHDQPTLFKCLKLLGVFLLSAILALAAGGLIGGLFGVWPDIHTFFEAISLATSWGLGVAVASGVLALGITNTVGWNAYGKFSLNPFAGIIETTASPHARTLRTGYWGKVKDAFIVIFGNSKEGFSNVFGVMDKGSPERFGLLDGATLSLFSAPEKLALVALHHSNPIIKGLGGLLLAVTIPLWIARLVLATILVFNPLSLLIIGVVHLVSEHYAGGGDLKTQIISKLATGTIEQSPPNLDLKNKSSVSGPFMDYSYPNKQQAIDNLTISLHNRSDNWTVHNTRLSGTPTDSIGYTPSIFDNANATKQDFEKALLTLNVDNLTQRLENSTEAEQTCHKHKSLLNLL
jgi:large subunit ribosomal protein L40e